MIYKLRKRKVSLVGGIRIPGASRHLGVWRMLLTQKSEISRFSRKTMLAVRRMSFPVAFRSNQTSDSGCRLAERRPAGHMNSSLVDRPNNQPFFTGSAIRPDAWRAVFRGCNLAPVETEILLVAQRLPVVKRVHVYTYNVENQVSSRVPCFDIGITDPV